MNAEKSRGELYHPISLVPQFHTCSHILFSTFTVESLKTTFPRLLFSIWNTRMASVFPDMTLTYT